MKKNLLLILLLPLLAGCSKEYRQARDVKKLDALSMQQPGEFLRLSNMLYPCFTGKAHSDTVTSVGKADTSVIWSVDTASFKLADKMPFSSSIYADTNRYMPKVITKTIRIVVPYYITIHDTVTNDRKITELVGLNLAAHDSITVVKTQLSQSNKSKSTWMWIAIGCMAAIGAAAIWQVYKLVNGGAIKKLI